MTNPGLAAPKPQRLISLDVVRGITIAFMIMVNNNGGPGSWGFMNHAAWNGLTPTDLVFPTFLFVVGISTVFATESRLAKGVSKAQIATHTAIRTVVLILFGLIVNNFPFFRLEHMRFYGVLQRIAVCYLIVGLFYLVDKRVWSKVVLLAVCLLGYAALVSYVPVPGAGLPGRDVPFLDKDQNIVAWVDRQLMPGHLYEEWTTHNTRDPEGLLSDIPAVGTALLGMIVGIGLRTNRSTTQKGIGLAIGCLACLALGYFWSIWFPLNKKMWTSSYVLVAAGWSLALLTAAFWTIDVKGWRKGWTYPWLVFGSNAIVAYMVSELLASLQDVIAIPDGPNHHASIGVWLFRHTSAHIPDPGWAAFSWAVLFAAVCFVPVWVLYRKKIFLKV